MRCLFLLCALSGCATTTPEWFSGTPRLYRDAAYDWLITASGSGSASEREAACEHARTDAWAAIETLFVDSYADRSAIIAAAGGPSRVESALHAFAETQAPFAQPLRFDYDDALRTCYIEVAWRLPRHLAEAVAQNGVTAPAEDVGRELK